MRQIAKSSISLVLVLALLVTAMPETLFRSLTARAEQGRSFTPAIVPEALKDILDRADAEAEAGLEQATGTWRYVLVSPEEYAVVTGYDGPAEAALSVPELLGDADVVGISAGALQDLSGIASVEVSGNVMAIGDGALPAGAIVRSTSGAYAQTWARRNGHAFSTTSDYQFVSGVVDFKDIREENFVRVSDTEVWLRSLEASRIREGSVFFLLDPANMYRISYYRVKAMSETKEGFVAVYCDTPDIDEVFLEYESKNEALMVDYSSLKLAEGVSLSQPVSQKRSFDGEFPTFTLPIKCELHPKVADNTELKIAVENKNTYSGDFHVGLLIQDVVSITNTSETKCTIGLSHKEKRTEKSGFKESLEQARKLAREKKTDQEIRQFLGTATVFSLAGIVTLTVSFYFEMSFEGEVSISYSNTSSVTYTYKQGEGLHEDREKAKSDEKTIEGSVKGTFKAGISFSLELYLTALRVASVSLFFGLKAEAEFTFGDQISALVNALTEYGDSTGWILKENYNANMADCISVSIHFVIEFEVALLDQEWTTLMKARPVIFDLPLTDLHYHFIQSIINKDKIIDDETGEISYRYRRDLHAAKNCVHKAKDCPYDTKTASFRAPEGGAWIYSYDDLDMGTEIQQPDIDFFSKYRRKLIAWHDNPSLDEESRVTWPYRIENNTFFYPETSLLHHINQINASGTAINAYSRFLVDDTPSATYAEREGFMAEDECYQLPYTLEDGTEISVWVRVPSRTDLTPMGDVMAPGDLFSMEKNDDSQIWLCALTDQDIMGRFHSGILESEEGSLEHYQIAFATRGGSLTVPDCDRTVPGYAFAGWKDEDGETILQPGETIQTDVDTPSVLSYYANWIYDGSVTPDQLENVAVGTIVPATGEKENDPAMFSWADDTGTDALSAASAGGVTITGFSAASGYAREYVEIPAEIDGRPVTAVADNAFAGCSTLRFIVFPETVTRIGSGALKNCANLKTVDLTLTGVSEIPDSFAEGSASLLGVLFPLGRPITAIGEKAFKGCAAVSRARINAPLGDYAFSGCRALASVTLGGSVTSIGCYVFEDCISLEAMSLPAQLESLGDYFLCGCSGLKSLHIRGSFDSLTSGKTFITNNGAVESVTIDFGVTSIGPSCFTGSNGYRNMTSISLPASVTSIAAGAFEECGLETLTIGFPAYAEMAEAFTGCNALREVNILSGRVSDKAFKGLPSLQTVTLGASVSAIGSEAFKGCALLSSIELPEGLRSIGANAFEGCAALASLNIPDSVEILGDRFIYGCTGLKDLSLGRTLDKLGGGAQNKFMVGQNAALETLTIREGCWFIPGWSFANNGNGFKMLTSISLPQSLVGIGSHAFAGSGITTLTLNSDMILYDNAFAGCEQLEELVFNYGDIGGHAFDGSSALKKAVVKRGTIGAYAFANCPNLEEVVLEEGVTGVGEYAFNNCAALKKLTFPDSVTDYGLNMIRGCTGLEELTLGAGLNESLNNDSCYLICAVDRNASLRILTLREGIEEIPEQMFANRTSNNMYVYERFPTLEIVNLPKSLRKIGRQAFVGSGVTELAFSGDVELEAGALSGMGQLKRVTFEGGIIGASALANCTSLEEVDLGRVTFLGSKAFENCTSLKSLTIPDSVEDMETDALSGCTGLEFLSFGPAYNSFGRYFGPRSDIGKDSQLKEVELREGVTYVDGYNDLPTLEKVSFPSTLKEIGSSAFESSGLRSVTLKGEVDIDNWAFRNCKNLLEADLEHVTGMWNAFSGDTALRKVTVHSGVIGSQCFSGCLNLRDVTLGDGVTEIMEGAFYNCRALERLVIPDSVTELNKYAGWTGHYNSVIQGCMNLRELYVGGGVKEIQCGYFYIGAESRLETVVIGEGVESINGYAFANTYNSGSSNYPKYVLLGFPSLTNVVFPTSLTSLASGAFKGAPLRKVDLPGSGSYSLSDYPSLRSASIGGGGVYFENCPALVSVKLGEGVTKLNSASFRNCSSLTSIRLPNSVVNVYELSFSGANGLKSISIGAGLDGLDAIWKRRLFCIGPEASLRYVEFREGITEVESNTFRNYLYEKGGREDWNTFYGFPTMEALALSRSVTVIQDENLRYLPNLRYLYLYAGTAINETGDVPTNLTLCSDVYDADIAAFAQVHGLVYLTGDDLPAFRLACMIPGEDGFVRLCEQQAAFGEVVEPQTPPVPDGMCFAGWYEDAEYMTPWTRTTMPAEDVTLYARFAPMVNLTFALDARAVGLEDTLPEGYAAWTSLQVPAGSAFFPPEVGQIDGYTFGGWYQDADWRRPVPRLAPDQDAVYYGKLQRIPAGARFEAVEGGVRLVKYTLEQDESVVVKLPESVNGQPLVGIAAGAFTNSGALILYIPKSVTDIPEGALAGSRLRFVIVNGNNPAFQSDQGNLYDKGKTTLLYIGQDNTSYTAPSELIRVGAYAAEGQTRLSTLSLYPVQTIGEYAFRGCTALNEVSLPSTLTTLEAGAFAGCFGMTKFTAMGLTEIDSHPETLPRNPGLQFYGPIGEGVLREHCTLSDGNGGTYTFDYNSYPITIKLGNRTDTLACEAGMPLPDALREIVLEDGTFVTGWFTDSALTTPWDLDADVMPGRALTLYAASKPLWAWTDDTVVDAQGESVTGHVLTAWNGTSMTLTVPTDIDGTAVVGLAEGFLNGAGHLDSITIPACVVFIADNALTTADGSLPGCVIADADSAAAAWARANGVPCQPIVYVLSFETGGEPLADIEAAKGTPVRLPVPIRDGREFDGWTTLPDDADARVTLNEAGFYAIPGSDTTLYALWKGEDEVVPFTWTARNGQVTITGYTGSEDGVTIPESINGWPVTAISAEAFKDRDDLRAFNLPATLVSIGERAFKSTSVSGMILPDSVSELGDGAFEDCVSLRRITLGSGLSRFDPDVFFGCTRLTQVSASGVHFRSVDGVLFSEDGGTLRFYPAGRAEGQYSMPAGVTKIGDKAFRCAASLTTIDMNNVQTIGEGAFMGCTGLGTLDLGEVTFIGDNAFFGCTGLETVALGEGLVKLGGFAFVGCRSLSEIAVPATVALDVNEIYFNKTNACIIGTVGSSAQAYALAYNMNFYDPNAAGVSTVTLSAETLELERGDIADLTAACLPENAQFGTTLTWSSSDTDIAVVEDGTVRAVGNGTAEITVFTDNGLSATCTVTVISAVRTMTINVLPPMTMGQQTALSVTFTPRHPSDEDVIWTSSDEQVVTVDGEGVATAVGLGRATITATATNGVSASTTAEVYIPVETFNMTMPQVTLYPLDGLNTLQMTMEILPQEATWRDVEYSSSENTIACIDENGLVTALGAGYTTITAYSTDPAAFIASQNLRVEKIPLEDTTVSGPLVLPYTGETICPEYSLTFKGCALTQNKHYYVNGNSFTDPGEYTVTFKPLSNDCSGSITLTVKVIDLAECVYDSIRLLPGLRGYLPLPEPQAMHFASSDEGVFTVGEDGLITAVGPGTAVLTVTLGDVSADCTVTVGREGVMKMPEALTDIGQEAFAQLPALHTVIMGENVTSIAENAFEDVNLLIVCPANSAAEQFALAQGLRHFTLEE